VPAATLAQPAADKERPRAALTHRGVPGRVTAADAKTGPAKTLRGAEVALSRAGAFVTVQDAVVQTAGVGTTQRRGAPDRPRAAAAAPRR
jgi:uncharacterized surface protein with fasciclin (FAS1) repeats